MRIISIHKQLEYKGHFMCKVLNNEAPNYINYLTCTYILSDAIPAPGTSLPGPRVDFYIYSEHLQLSLVHFYGTSYTYSQIAQLLQAEFRVHLEGVTDDRF